MNEEKPIITETRLSEIRFNESLYPRKEHNPALVQQYAEILAEIEGRGNFIAVSKDMTLLDGRHRYLAYVKNGDGNLDIKIPVFLYDLESDEDKYAKAIELNSAHGKQLTQEEKMRNARRLYETHHWPVEKIAKLVSVRKASVCEWTKAAHEIEKRQQNETIFNMYLACYTADEIGQAVGLSEQTIRDRIARFPTKEFLGTKSWKLSRFEDYDEEEGLRPIYNIWTFQKKTNEVSHFGNSESRIVDRLLYLYTEPFDIVVDSFAGGGSTIDVCKKRSRRYWTSDRKPIPERAHEIRQLDVVESLPALNNRWSEVALTYLDPPYWKQAEGKYSKDAADLANMPLEDFNKALSGIVNGIARKQSRGVIALLIQPTQWNAPGREFTDHVYDMLRLADPKRLRLVNRISCPYSSQQCTPQMVEYAKERKELLVLTRELIIWRIL
jgi:predicted DNA-binding protein YlxM (UPF0122 family)